MHKQMILVARGVERKPAAARLLGLRVLIPLKAWSLSVCCELCG